MEQTLLRTNDTIETSRGSIEVEIDDITVIDEIKDTLESLIEKAAVDIKELKALIFTDDIMDIPVVALFKGRDMVAMENAWSWE